MKKCALESGENLVVTLVVETFLTCTVETLHNRQEAVQKQGI